LEFPTLDDANVKGKTVLVRVDINSPISKTGDLLDDTRIRECAPTLKELANGGAKIVLLAHQGRPGDEDFTTLEKHATALTKALGLHVRYIDDILGPMAKTAIKTLRLSEILMLENVRFLAEESLSGSPEDMAKTHLVQSLSKLVEIYVNDAFAAIHRGSPSLVGFGAVLPTFAGRLMERELKGLSRARSPEHPCVYVLGGAKVDDSLTITENVLSKGIADLVLTGGLVGQTLLASAGHNLGKPNLELLVKKGYQKLIDVGKEMLARYPGKIKIPVDVLVDDNGHPKEITAEQLPTELVMRDIGSRTVAEYSKAIEGAKTVVANGPLGMFENPTYANGTFEVLRAMARSPAFTIIGGGHVVAAVQAAGVAGQIKHVSTGGGACISFLAGEKLPVVEMLTKKVKA